jgi:hypothetical protein
MTGIVSMSTLGKLAQWGNHVVQYAFIRSYAKGLGAEYRVPRWAGQYLFGFKDQPVTRRLEKYQERTVPVPAGRVGLPIPPRGTECLNKDFFGFAQYDTAYYQRHKEFIQSLYANPVEPQASRVEKILHDLKERGDTIIGMHLRRGDIGRTIYPITPIEWCLRWLHFNWRRFSNPVLYISTEDETLASWFKNYNPCLPEDLGVVFTAKPYPFYTYPFSVKRAKARQLDFFPDWYILQHSDVVLASDSSFSMTAAWTSTTIKEVWRAKLSIRGFELTNPWNMHFCNREHMEDFPGIPGISVDSNPGLGWDGFTQTVKAIPEDPATFFKYMEPAR